jgi:hypothetical protein
MGIVLEGVVEVKIWHLKKRKEKTQKTSGSASGCVPTKRWLCYDQSSRSAERAMILPRLIFLSSCLILSFGYHRLDNPTSESFWKTQTHQGQPVIITNAISTWELVAAPEPLSVLSDILKDIKVNVWEFSESSSAKSREMTFCQFVAACINWKNSIGPRVYLQWRDLPTPESEIVIITIIIIILLLLLLLLLILLLLLLLLFTTNSSKRE